MSIHFKFKSAKDFDTISFQGPFITLGELKKAILAKKRLTRSTDMDLEVVNAQDNEGLSSESVNVRCFLLQNSVQGREYTNPTQCVCICQPNSDREVR